MKKLFIASISALVFASPALAEGFNGFRVEAHAGYDKVSLEDNFLGIDDSGDGVVYGVGLGYDAEIGQSFVVGVEGNADLSSAKKCGAFLGGDELCLKAKRVLDIGVRAGVKVDPSWLVYGKAGYANGRIKLTYDDFIDPTNSFSAADNGGGVRLGAGIETLLGSNSFAKVEYRYTDYEGGFSQNQVVFGAGMRF